MQLPIVIKNKFHFRQASSDNVHMYFNFHPNRVGNQSKLCTQIYLQKRKLHKIATKTVIFEKKTIISVMYHRKAFINFQQNRVDISIKTVHTNIFAKQRKCDRQHICGSQYHAISKLPSMVEVGYKIWGGGPNTEPCGTPPIM